MDTPQHYKYPSLASHAWILQQSLLRLTTQPLIDTATSGQEVLNALKTARFAVVSHGTEQNPIFNYANPCALQLFEMDWEAFTQLQSRKSAEAPNRDERQQLLDAVSNHGYIDNYTGIRISATGRRFRIQNATVWNLYDSTEQYCGQAALIRNWTQLRVQSA